jgi:aminoglycoside 2'-N-acetyltransferase I
VTEQPATFRLVHENDLTASDRVLIRGLLTAAFPDYATLWEERDFWGGPIEHRLLLRNISGQLIGHLGFAHRLIEVGDQRIKIAGIGAVAILPDDQGQGWGRRLLSKLETHLAAAAEVEFGFLQCHDIVVPFYEKLGFHRIAQQVRSFDPRHLRWLTDDAAALIVPISAARETWPGDGIVDLMGMPW